MKNIKLFENFENSKFELIGDNIDDVLYAVKSLKFHYGKKSIKISDSSGHKSYDKIGVYVEFDPNIKLRSSGVDPKSNIVREINYILNEEEINVKLYKID